MKAFHRNGKGFTLIEVVVVIAILAVLSGIVTVSVIKIKENAEEKSAKTSLGSYWRVTSQYFDQVNRHLTASSTPNAATLKTRLNLQDEGSKQILSLSKEEFNKETFADGCVHIQYEENSKSIKNKYTIKRITLKYKGNYYWTENGEDISKSTS